MEILNLSGSYEPSARAPKKQFKVLLGVGLLAAVVGMGSTLAASITLSSGSPVEFGQGIAATTACDSSLTVTPFSTYQNRETATAGDFGFTSVAISNIDTSTPNTTTGAGCGGRYLVLKAYTDTGTAAAKYAVATTLSGALYLGWKYSGANLGYVTGGVANSGTGYNSGISIYIPASGSTCTVKVAATADNAAVTCAMTAGAAGAASLIITFNGGSGANVTATVPSSAVSKLTLESTASDPSGYV